MMRVDLKPEHLATVNLILEKLVPDKTVWAYGSRVSGKSKPRSDLDIVVFNADAKEIGDLKEAFDESDLPFSVDVMDWEKIPDDFKENIRSMNVVLR